MQEVSAAFTTAAGAWPRTVSPRLYVKWDGTNWVEETDYVRVSGPLSGTSEGGATEVGPSALGASRADTLSFLLHNSAGRFSRFRTDGALYAYISTDGGYGKQVKAEVGVVIAGGSTEYVQVFLGVLKEPQEISYPKQVRFEALGIATRAATQRVSTVLYENIRADEYIANLAALLDLQPTSSILETGVDTYPFAWADDEPVWNEMQDIAGAEGGRVFFDAAGNLRFHNYVHLALTTSADATFTAADYFENLTPEPDFENIWNHIIVKWRPRYLGGLQRVWELSEPVRIPPGGTVTHWAQFSTGVKNAIEPVAEVDFSARTSSFVDKTSSVTVSKTTTYAQRTLLSIVNLDATVTVYIDKMQIRGYPVLTREERTTEAEDQDSIDAYGERVKEVDNFYVQNESAANAIASALLYRYKNPREAVRITNLRGLPQMEVGDRITVNDAARTGINRDFYVAGFDWTMLYNLYTQNLWGIDAVNMVPRSNYFKVSSSTAGCTSLGSVGVLFW